MRNAPAFDTLGSQRWVPDTSSVVGHSRHDAAGDRARAMAGAKYAPQPTMLEKHYFGFSGVVQMGRGYATLPIVTLTYGSSWESSLSYQPKASYVPSGVMGTGADSYG